MGQDRQILFNHIPKTGGVTLRIILNRVYGEQNIFLIKSTDIGNSLEAFGKLSPPERQKYSVIAGHGAEMFSGYLDNPFRVTILREPIALFISQYYFLKYSTGTDFYEDVSRINSIEEYLDYAILKGQDNLLTRHLSNSVHFLANPTLPVPDMQHKGEELLVTAMKNLEIYDAVIDLASFDAGVYALAEQQGWKAIPIYRPSNRNRRKPGNAGSRVADPDRLSEALKYDIRLYQEFKSRKMGLENKVQTNSAGYRAFELRQRGIRLAAKVLRKRG